MADLQIRCGKCGKSYPPGVMKFFDESENLICTNCHSRVQNVRQPQRQQGGFFEKLGFFKSKIQNRDYTVIGSPEIIKQSEEEIRRNTIPLKLKNGPGPEQKVRVSEMAYVKCLDCSYKFKAHKGSATTKRCPYCGKTNLHSQIELVREIDNVGMY